MIRNVCRNCFSLMIITISSDFEQFASNPRTLCSFHPFGFNRCVFVRNFWKHLLPKENWVPDLLNPHFMLLCYMYNCNILWINIECINTWKHSLSIYLVLWIVITHACSFPWLFHPFPIRRPAKKESCLCLQQTNSFWRFLFVFVLFCFVLHFFCHSNS